MIEINIDDGDYEFGSFDGPQNGDNNVVPEQIFQAGLRQRVNLLVVRRTFDKATHCDFGEDIVRQSTKGDLC